MEVKCQIDTSRTTKSGMKVVLHLDKEQKKLFQRNQANFEDMPLIVEFKIDADKRRKILATISHEMRAKIHAIFNDISKWSGQSADSVKEELKQKFLSNEVYSKYDDFSFSNCSKELASDFINFLIAWCFINGVELNENPRELFDDIENYLYICLKYRKCVICGRPAERHHVDAIGMGRDRKHYDDSQHLKMALCNAHHQTGPNSIHNLGVDTFCEKYHVHGILFND